MKATPFASIFLAGLTLAAATCVSAETMSSSEQIKAEPVFTSPLDWVGTQQPSESESAALLKAINVFKTDNIPAGFVALEGFLSAYPNSAWNPSLDVNMAEYYRSHGRYSLALSHWQSAWNATKANKEPTAQKLAVRTIAGWTRLLASLGEKEKLNDLFNEVNALQSPLGIYATMINETKEGLAVMNTKPGESYRCGSFALARLAMALRLDGKISDKLFDVDSPDGGFNMSQLLALAQTNGIAVEAVRRPADADLVVPSVVHWKLNHYAAIVEKKGDLYRVEDPTFESHVWMNAATINAEASGEFILPKDKVPLSWQKLTEAECTRIYGKGYPNDINDLNDSGLKNGCGSDSDEEDDDCDPPASNDGAGNGGGNPPGDPCCGMPQWMVSEPYITLWLKDSPLLYHLSNGKSKPLTLSYKHRGEAQNSEFGGFGDKWSCNWLGMLQQQAGSDTAVDHLAGGGQSSFNTDGTLDYKTARSFQMVYVGVEDPPAIVTPTGAQNIYGYSTTDLTGTTNYFLTERMDRYGRILEKFHYETIGTLVRLTNMVDMDGRTNTLAYSNGTYPYLITTVTDPYGHTAYFNYDSNGLLTNMVDVQGMSSSFQYDGNEYITNMITLYGTNSFQYLDTIITSDSMAVERTLLIKEPTGDHQLYIYQDHPTNGDFLDMASYHWNRRQYDAISSPSKANLLFMAADDFNIAPVKHWLHGDNIGTEFTISDTMDVSADPYDAVLGYRPEVVQYSYQGQSGNHIGDSASGALDRVVSIQVNDNLAVSIGRNSLGRPTNYVYYGSDGSTASYTNVFDVSGSILQYETGPRGELTRGYGYDPVITNLLVSVTNAVGDVLQYTHDANLRVTSITFPGGLVRTNIYYATGPSKGFLQMQIDIGFRTNSFDYANGNLLVQTNEMGLVTTNIWDNLNRLLSTAFPDGTTISNVYDKLDIVATKDRLNQWTYYGYNAVRQLMAVTNVNGQVTTYDYCGCGSPDEIIRWNGSTPVVDQFSYNMGGLLTNAFYADGYQLNYIYDEFNQPATVSDGAGNESQLYDVQKGLQNKVYYATLGGSQILSRQFDEYGRVTNSVDRNNVTTAQSYDFLDRLVTRQSFRPFSDQGGEENFIYDSLGLTNYTDQLGHPTTFVRDTAGRVLYQTNANNEVLQFTYNPEDELLTLVDGKNQMTSWGYDTFGRVTNKVDALGANIFRYQYDANDRLTNRWSAAKGSTTYKYDPLGNLTNVVYPVSSDLVFRYDPLNRLTNMVDGVGSTVFAWTEGDQLGGETGPWDNDTVNYTYNAARQRGALSLLQPNASPWTQGYVYDDVMRLATVASASGNFTYGYSAGSDRAQELQFTDDGSFYIYNAYDGLARLQSSRLITPFTSYGTPANELQYAYDEGSQRTQQVFTAGNYINYTYDNIGQLKSAKGLESDGTTARLQEQMGYTYDAAWNLSQRTNNALVQNFAVNSLNELSGASRSGTFTVAGTTTEPGSDISGVTVDGTGLSSGGAAVYADGSWARAGATLADGANTYNATATDTDGRTDSSSVSANLPASPSYLYDGNGNLTNDGTRNFAYDDENQLISVWKASAWSNSFAYDGMNRRRVEKDYSWNGSSWVKTNEVRYVYDVNLVIQERDQNNLPLVTYTRGNDLSGGLQDAGGIGGLLARTDNGKMIAGDWQASAYYFFDGNGNVAGLVYTNGLLAAQYNYDPFGNILTMNGPLAQANHYRFSSKEWNDNASLYYYGYRSYDPNLQRWLNRDPMEENGGINIYQFVDNSPISWFDPFGLDKMMACNALKMGLIRGGTAEALGGGPEDLIGDAIAAGVLLGYTAYAGYQYFHAPVMSSSFPHGYMPGPSGAKAWGRKNGVGAKEGGNRFHDIKKGDTMSNAPDKYGVNPDTGDVIDPEGNSVGNLNETPSTDCGK